jgi:hypothetical protein
MNGEINLLTLLSRVALMSWLTKRMVILAMPLGLTSA